MSDATIYESQVRSARDVGAVFEWDGVTGYFYLCALGPGDAPKVLRHIHILSGQRDFDHADLEIRWDAEERVVGLLIRGRPWAAFDTASGEAFGGGYSVTGEPDLPLVLQVALMRQ